MANNYTRWYREGTISATQNSNVITGQNTLWQSIGLKPGDMFSIDNITEYEIDTITDNTHLTLKTNYVGASVSNVKYRIIRNWTANSNADVAAMASELLGDVARYLDKDLQTLTGKSAYKAACDNGFVGTESEWLASLDAYGVAVKNGYTGTRAQWLESLKAAGEWTQANSRITTLETDNTSNKSKISALEEVNAGTRLTELETAKTTQEAEIAYLWDLSGVNKRSDGKIQYHIRGKNLGTTITAAQYNAICNKNGANPFDVQLGDGWSYWGSNIYIIVTVIERSISYAYLAIAIGTAWPNTNEFLNTQKRSRMHSENDASVSFANTEMWTENLPLWENYLSENGFPVQYLKEFAHTYYSAPNENGVSTAISLKGKLHLFNVCDVCECDYAVTGMKRPLKPYTFFKHARVDAAGYQLQTADPVSATQYVLIQGGNPYVKINATSVLNEVTCLAYIAA